MRHAILLLLSFLTIYANARTRAQVEADMVAFENSLNLCQKAQALLDGQIKCVQAELDRVKIYKDAFYVEFKTRVFGGMNGPEALQKFEKTEAMWMQYRRDMCNFAAEARTDDKSYAKFRGLLCVFKVTLARIRELYGTDY